MMKKHDSFMLGGLSVGALVLGALGVPAYAAEPLSPDFPARLEDQRPDKIAAAPIAKDTAARTLEVKPAGKAAPKAAGQSPSALPAKASQFESVRLAADLPTSLAVMTGRGHLLRLSAPIKRVSVGDPKILDFTVIAPTQLLLNGKSAGATNLTLWDRDEHSHDISVDVEMDLRPLRQAIRSALPHETDVSLSVLANSIVLRGTVSDVIAADAIQQLAQAHLDAMLLRMRMTASSSLPVAAGGGTPSFAGGAETPQTTMIVDTREGRAVRDKEREPKVINFLKIRDAQQVMLEVRIAEVSKNLLEKLGVGYQGSGTAGSYGWSMFTKLLTSTTSVPPMFGLTKGAQSLSVEASKNDELVKMLAEPTIVSMSGQEGSFLVGGKIFIPVSLGVTGGVSLEERSYGVGLKFVPTVLDNGRISLKVAPEVSELSQEAVTASVVNSTTENSVNKATTTMPSFKTSNVSTTVQMREGESLVIGGLLRDNIVETVNAVPLLGELPILGALFRSSEFLSKRTELVVMVRPTLVKGSRDPVPLPTDAFVVPSRSEFFLEGKLEGRPPSPRFVD